MERFGAAFLHKVFAIGFTDSVHRSRFQNDKLDAHFKKVLFNFTLKHVRATVIDIQQFIVVLQVAVNWVTSQMPLDSIIERGSDCPCRSAGVLKHELTSYSAKDSVFKFLRDRLSEGNVNMIYMNMKLYKAAKSGFCVSDSGIINSCISLIMQCI